MLGEPSRSFQQCPIHFTMYELGARCCKCDAVTASRDALGVLEARIADHDSELSALRRQVIELRHIVLDLQRVHNERVRS